jgi:hypothetical protein
MRCLASVQHFDSLCLCFVHQGFGPLSGVHVMVVGHGRGVTGLQLAQKCVQVEGACVLSSRHAKQDAWFYMQRVEVELN